MTKEQLDALPEPVIVSRVGSSPADRPVWRVQMKHVVEAALRLRGPVPGVIRDVVTKRAGRLSPKLNPVSVTRDGSPATQTWPSYRVGMDLPVAQALGPDIERVMRDAIYAAARERAA